MLNDSNQKQPVHVCAAVVFHQQKILLTLRPEDKKLGGYWEFPGGKIEKGESPQLALQRELREELDIEVGVGALLETVHHSYEWGDVKILAYTCTWKSGTIKHLEVADHSWVAPENLLDYDILTADRPIIRKLQEQYSG
ncbi:(deoxy)nucleoside triphosphate pyrophosphohydrolase [uncultured Desulfuromusa sp.]|uniref:(deoxy)nucleoside triphosphate pyrophosphohydrolase n=1 Tax=uncultured Desulfuromusa sp. TaxID=219183 RepID=UPI002AA7BA13|nr:(deoxy)nucleoside triphosphate pyrophosphohydrolase [uncultured Desulfuromusa sp.]